MFTEQDSKKQDDVFEELKNEFHRLSAQEAEMRKATDPENTFSADQVDAEVLKMGEEAKEKAKKAGAARVAQFLATTQQPSTTQRPGSHRQGVMRI